MSSEVIIIPLFFAAIAAVLITVNQIFGNVMRRRYLHRERMVAMEKGVPLPDDIMTDLEADRSRTGQRVGLQGVVWTCLGIGLIISTQVVRGTSLGSESHEFLDFVSLWAYPAVTVGLGLMLYAWFTRTPPSPRG